MKRFSILHRTEYTYSAPVRLGPHRMMLRPRDSHDLDLDQTGLTIDPQPGVLRWLHDVSDNSVAIAEFNDTPTDRLTIESHLVLNDYGLAAPDIVLDPAAETWPFDYAENEAPDLVPFRQRVHADHDGRLRRWALGFIPKDGEIRTQALLVAMMETIRSALAYSRREQPGIQSPTDTLAHGGTCRDFAVLMMEALRCLGFATRFVSGYLFDPASDPGGPAEAGVGHVGGGATHAWLDVYLPGAGWVPFDPTNALYGGADLIRVASARDPRAALPLTGSFRADTPVTSSMAVTVTVDRIG